VPFLWSESQYSTGVPVVDAQHKEMFEHIERMVAASELKEKESEFVEMLEFLNGYVVEHFTCEEKEMKKCECPALKENESDHKQFIEKLKNIHARFETEGNTRPLREELMGLAVQWLEAHIAKVDSKLRESVN
jgi:hemerythrin